MGKVEDGKDIQGRLNDDALKLVKRQAILPRMQQC